MNYQILAVGGIVSISLLALFYKIQRKLIYHPYPFYSDLEQYVLMGYFESGYLEEIQVKTEDSLTLTGWYRRAKPSFPTIVFFHGNASYIGQSYQKLRRFMDLGYGALLCEYRGYCDNPGSPTEQGLYKDATAYLKWLIVTQKIQGKDTILYGQSLGTGVAVQMATEFFGIRKVILESPYTSFVDLAKRHYPFIPFAKSLILDHYANIDKIGKINCPILILHGKYDTVVPYECAQKLATKGHHVQLRTFSGGHNNLFDLGAVEEIEKFLAQ